MTLGIMQPYFFPYPGYFSLIAATETWVVFDTPQYIRHGWINRNRVLTTGKDEWKYVRIPVRKGSRDRLINQIEIDESVDWRSDIVRKLDYYKIHKAPHFDETIDLVSRAMDVEESNLAKLVTSCLKSTCDYLGLRSQAIHVLSELDLEIKPAEHAGEWALRISEALRATTYINSIGGREIFDETQFEASGIELRFLQPSMREYNQHRPAFVPRLSIIDALMWNSREDVRNLVNDYELVS